MWNSRLECRPRSREIQPRDNQGVAFGRNINRKQLYRLKRVRTVSMYSPLTVFGGIVRAEYLN